MRSGRPSPNQTSSCMLKMYYHIHTNRHSKTGVLSSRNPVSASSQSSMHAYTFLFSSIISSPPPPPPPPFRNYNHLHYPASTLGPEGTISVDEQTPLVSRMLHPLFLIWAYRRFVTVSSQTDISTPAFLTSDLFVPVVFSSIIATFIQSFFLSHQLTKPSHCYPAFPFYPVCDLYHTHCSLCVSFSWYK